MGESGKTALIVVTSDHEKRMERYRGNWKIRKAGTAKTENGNGIYLCQVNTPATELAESDLSFLNWTIV